jgi:hypothetical protein
MHVFIGEKESERAENFMPSRMNRFSNKALTRSKMATQERRKEEKGTKV